MKKIEVSQYYEARIIKVIDEATDRIVASVVDFADGRHFEDGTNEPENYKLLLQAMTELE